MKTKLFLTVSMLVSVAALVYAAPTAKVSDAKIAGDYVEARTAAVFAGACHYNGELVTVGKDAVMAWNFSGGSYNGVDLAGVRAVMAVTCEQSLAIDEAARKSELVVDPSATAAQVKAVAALFEARLSKQIGKIASIRRAPVSFVHDTTGYTVEATGFASLAVQYRPDDSCCKQPNEVWFSPLSPIERRVVGFTEKASFSGSIAERWERYGENSAFYGAIAF